MQGKVFATMRSWWQFAPGVRTMALLMYVRPAGSTAINSPAAEGFHLLHRTIIRKQSCKKGNIPSMCVQLPTQHSCFCRRTMVKCYDENTQPSSVTNKALSFINHIILIMEINVPELLFILWGETIPLLSSGRWSLGQGKAGHRPRLASFSVLAHWIFTKGQGKGQHIPVSSVMGKMLPNLTTESFQ